MTAPPQSGEATTPATRADQSVIAGLLALAEALAVLDGTDPDTDSITFDRATDQVIAAARDVVTAARPVLAQPEAVAAAVRDAVADMREVMGRCWACHSAPTGPCIDHAADLAQVAVYETLLPVLTYGNRS